MIKGYGKGAIQTRSVVTDPLYLYAYMNDMIQHPLNNILLVSTLTQAVGSVLHF